MNELETEGGLSPWGILSQRWGHPLHSMCSYLGTFPPSLARAMLTLLSKEGDIVMDPFSGRGTMLLEARLLGRYPVATDLNPIAIALSKAKNVSVSRQDILDRIEELRHGYDRLLYLPEAQVQGDDIQLIFHPETLAQLCYLRRRLCRSGSAIDTFLLGALLGVMHGSERQDGSSAYASISMPNTFSMSPTYVRKFVANNKLNRIGRDVFRILEEKMDRLSKEAWPNSGEGIVAAADAKNLSLVDQIAPFKGKVKLVVTSPPYLGVVNYAKQNWIRTWLLDPMPDSHLAESLDDNLTLTGWLDFVETVILQLREMMAPDGVLVFVVGDVAKSGKGYISLAREFIQRIVHDKVFSYVGCIDDHIGGEAKTTRIWKETKGRATDIDRIIIMSNVEPEFNFDQLSLSLGLPEDSSLPTRINAKVLAETAARLSSISQ
jgi:hypothetical protein